MSSKLVDALKRAIRTYIQVAGPALGTLAIAALNDNAVIDFAAWKVALLSGVPAVAAFLWRTLLDPSSIPSLTVDAPKSTTA